MQSFCYCASPNIMPIDTEVVATITSLVVTAVISISIVVYCLVMMAKDPSNRTEYLNAVTTILCLWWPSMGSFVTASVKKVATVVNPPAAPIEA